jgi:hypothetical protein
MGALAWCACLTLYRRGRERQWREVGERLKIINNCDSGIGNIGLWFKFYLLLEIILHIF